MEHPDQNYLDTYSYLLPFDRAAGMYLFLESSFTFGDFIVKRYISRVTLQNGELQVVSEDEYCSHDVAFYTGSRNWFFS
jgi:hypothetical protein